MRSKEQYIFIIHLLKKLFLFKSLFLCCTLVLFVYNFNFVCVIESLIISKRLNGSCLTNIWSASHFAFVVPVGAL